MSSGISVIGLFILLAFGGGIVTVMVVVIAMIMRRSGWRNDPNFIACSKCNGPVNIEFDTCSKCGTPLKD